MPTVCAARGMAVAVAMSLLFTATARPAGGVDQPPASIQDAQKTVWDGVFTKEQSARGRQHYRRFCGQCHSDDLSGGGDGEPALAGVIFMAQWQGRSVAELFAVISENMPYSAPGSLRGQEYVDIVSYLLEVNGVPAGPIELSNDRDQLKHILVTEKAGRPGP
jgi:cytochrome c